MVTKIKHALSITLTTECNYSCDSCLNTSLPDTSLQNIEDLVFFTKKANYYWSDIILTGGEPTIHPHFNQIVERLSELKTSNLGQVSVKSNGAKRIKPSIASKIDDLALSLYGDWNRRKINSALPYYKELGVKVRVADHSDDTKGGKWVVFPQTLPPYPPAPWVCDCDFYHMTQHRIFYCYGVEGYAPHIDPKFLKDKMVTLQDNFMAPFINDSCKMNDVCKICWSNQGVRKALKKEATWHFGERFKPRFPLGFFVDLDEL
jgi:hypothetical protein